MLPACLPPLPPSIQPPTPPTLLNSPIQPLQDTWLPEQVAFVAAMGNAHANEFWEARLPADFRRPPENDMGLLRTFITDKYVARRYAAREYPEPPNIDTYTTHPVRLRLLGRVQACCDAWQF